MPPPTHLLILGNICIGMQTKDLGLCCDGKAPHVLNVVLVGTLRGRIVQPGGRVAVRVIYNSLREGTRVSNLQANCRLNPKEVLELT